MEGSAVKRENRNLEIHLPPGGVDWRKVEKDLLLQALEMSGGNQVRAARLLSLTRDAFRYRLLKFGLIATEPELCVENKLP